MGRRGERRGASKGARREREGMGGREREGRGRRESEKGEGWGRRKAAAEMRGDARQP